MSPAGAPVSDESHAVTRPPPTNSPAGRS